MMLKAILGLGFFNFFGPILYYPGQNGFLLKCRDSAFQVFCLPGLIEVFFRPHSPFQLTCPLLADEHIFGHILPLLTFTQITMHSGSLF